MIALPYDYFLIVWFLLATASTAYVAFDQFNGNPEPTVMKWGFVLVTLYMGPFGLLLYVLTDKEPRFGEHDRFTSPLWKQGTGSTIHCIAGDATGIILAAAVTALMGLPMWIDLIVEYVAGFSFGLFIFQSLFMKKMMGGTYWENVRKSFMPEFISMNAVMAVMAPTMSLLMMGRDMRAMDPLELVFWGVMSLGVMVGFATAYPFNVWMVKKKIKHGQILLGKLALFGGMLALAVANRFWLVPSMGRIRTDAAEGLTRSSARLRNHVLGEQFLGWMVLLAVSILGTMQPALG